MNRVADRKKRIAVILINVALAPVFFIFYLKRRGHLQSGSSVKTAPKTILIVRLDHIGDVVLASALPSHLRSKYPKSNIIFLVGSWSREVLENNPDVSEILTLDCPWWQKIRKDANRLPFWRRYFSVLQHLRRLDLDVCIELRGDIRHLILFGMLANAKMVISSNRTGGGMIITDEITFTGSEHEFIKSFRHLEPLGITGVPGTPKIFVSHEQKQKTQILLDEAKVGDDKVLVAFCPGARLLVKQLTIEKNIEICQAILDELHERITIILIGGKSDVEVCSKIAAGFAGSIHDLSGRTSLGMLVQLFSVADVIVGVDSGALHIAASSRTPIIAMFGPTDEALYRPFSPIAQVISTDCKCDRRLHLDCRLNPGGSGKCLEGIDAEDVAHRVKLAIGQRKSKKAPSLIGQRV